MNMKKVTRVLTAILALILMCSMAAVSASAAVSQPASKSVTASAAVSQPASKSVSAVAAGAQPASNQAVASATASQHASNQAVASATASQPASNQPATYSTTASQPLNVPAGLMLPGDRKIPTFISPYHYSKELPPTLTFGDLNFSNPAVERATQVYLAATKQLTRQTNTPSFKMDTGDGSIDVYTIQPDDTQTRPAILYCHGGGFMFPVQANQIAFSKIFVEKTGARVFLPDYRCAPEYPFPTPFEDCYETYLYMLNHADELHIDPKKIIVYGDSAGGSLAAAVCQKARDEHVQAPAAQMLIYPVTDNSQTTKSLDEYAYGAWSKTSNRQMWEIYLKNGDYGELQYAAPLQAKDFSNLPKAYVEPSEIDALRDEGIAYADKLKSAGNDVTVNIIKGAYHGFDGQLFSPLTRRVFETRTQFMNAVFQK